MFLILLFLIIDLLAICSMINYWLNQKSMVLFDMISLCSLLLSMAFILLFTLGENYLKIVYETDYYWVYLNLALSIIGSILIGIPWMLSFVYDVLKRMKK